MPRCVTRASLPPSGPELRRLHRLQRADTRRAWSALQRTARGEQLAWVTPVKWIPQTAVNGRTVTNMLDYYRALKEGSGKTMSFQIVRDGTEVSIGLPA